MNAAEPVEATPTDGYARGIVDESSSAQQISAGGDQSNTSSGRRSSGGRGRPRGRRGTTKGSGRPRRQVASTPVPVVQGLAMASSGTSRASDTTNTSTSNERRQSRSNRWTIPEQTSGSARAPSIRETALHTSQSTGLRTNATYEAGYYIAQINARQNMNSSGAEAEERIDSRADDATMERVEQHGNTHRAPLSPAAPPLPHNSEPLSGQSDTPSLDVCVPCPPQTDRDRSRICFCDGLPQDGIIDASLLWCQGKGRRCSIKFYKHCLQEFG